MKYIFWDFEFATGRVEEDVQSGELPKPICVAWRTSEGQSGVKWLDGLQSPVEALPLALGDVLVGFFTSAEFGCHLVLGWSLNAEVIDLFAEHRVLTNGIEVNNSLLASCEYFGVTHAADSEHKHAMQMLCAAGGPFSVEEQKAILDYCADDVRATEQLFNAMKDSINMPLAKVRGEYMKCLARIENRGIPIDMEALTGMRKHWEAIKLELIKKVDVQYGVYSNGKFNMERFAEYLNREKIHWPRTPSGMLSTEDDTFKSMMKVHPQITALRELRVTLGKMRLNKLAVGSDGRNRCMLSPFKSKTGRNQPSSNAYLFGPSRWLRSLAKPGPGMTIAYLDFKSQEFAIAAYLSGDKNMIEAYETGDPYMATAIMMNLAPEGATKVSHPDARGIGKILVLGIGYGAGAAHIAEMLNKPRVYATELIHKHKKVYKTYWQWHEKHMDNVLLSRQCCTPLGWRIQVEKDADKPRTLGNWPMQSGGSDILRVSVIMLEEAGIPVVATIHDAVLIEVPTAESNGLVAEAQRIMERASLVVSSGKVTVDADVYSYPERYVADGGLPMWNQIQEIMGRLK